MCSDVIKKRFEDLTPWDLYNILDLRGEVFLIEQEIFYLDTDGKDQESMHWFIMDGDVMVSYLRVLPPGLKYGEHSIGRVATKASYRRQGLASKLIKAVISDIQGMPIRISAQAYLASYYMTFGFKTVSDVYIEEGLEHVEMLLPGD
jgi:ElaA protein